MFPTTGSPGAGLVARQAGAAAPEWPYGPFPPRPL